jgi:hypothetical protein
MNYVPAPKEALPEAENTFFLRGQPSRIGKLLAHYELYKAITGLPGDLLELGVYKGASLARFAAFRSLLENDFSRAIHGFDAFGAFPRGGVESRLDQEFIDRFEGERGEGIARADLEAILAEKPYRNVHLHEGNIFDTVPALLKRDPSLKIALLHLDVDVYEPTAFALDQLVPHMSRGGLILFDDYGMVEGATRAGDEVAARLGLRFEKLPLYAVPAFLRMP